jgi:hypothetical protein
VLQALLLALLVGSPTSVAGEAAAPAAVELHPGVVLAAATPRVFVALPDGAVAAYDLPSTEAVWRTQAAVWPLAHAGRWLLARVGGEEPAGHVALVLIDTTSPAATPRVMRLPLPAGARPHLTDTLAESFRMTARAQAPGFRVRWRHLRRPVRAMPGPDEEVRLDGEALVDVEKATVRSIEADVPTGDALPAALQARVADGSLRRAPWRAGSSWILVEREADPPVVRVRRWRDDGRPLDERRIAVGEDLVAQLASADGRHLVLSLRVESPPSAGLDHAWRLWDLGADREVARVPQRRSAAPFAIRGATLAHVEFPWAARVDGHTERHGLSLRIVDIAGRRPPSHIPVRDLAYRGPYPPGAPR